MQTNRLSFRFYYVLLTVLLILSLVVSTRVGAVDISYEKIFAFIRHRMGLGSGRLFSAYRGSPVFQIRLPRVILCAFVGAALSVAGAMMQALFRNPIVEPGLVELLQAQRSARRLFL